MENIERFSTLEMGQINKSVKRIVEKSIDAFLKLQSEEGEEITPPKIEALRNALFLKYNYIDYELIFTSFMKDRKFSDGVTRYE